MPGKKIKLRRKKREILVSLLFFLNREQKLAVDRWLRGRKEFREIKKADFVIISPPKSGRTWLRTMLSRFFQHRYDLPENELLGYDNYHRMNPAIPRIRFSHDRYVNLYTGNRDSKRDFYDKKVVLMVRDPRDVVASNYFQWINCVNPYKKKLLNIPDRPEQTPIFEYAMTQQFGIPRTVNFLRAWAPEIDKTRAHLLIRYEDMRRETAPVLKELLAFMGFEASDEEIRQIVEETSFENMKKLEKEQAFSSDGSGSRRLMVKDPDNPESFKVRRGKVGGYTDYFSEQELEEIDRLIAQIPALYGYSPRNTAGS